MKQSGSRGPSTANIAALLSAALDTMVGGTHAAGDMLIRSASAWGAFAKGASNTILTAGGNYVTLSALLDLLGSAAEGQLLRRGAAVWAFLNPGDQFRILEMGTATSQQWSALGTVLGRMLTVRGDLLRAGIGAAVERLAIGAAGTVLTSDGVDAAWAAPAGGAAASVRVYKTANQLTNTGVDTTVSFDAEEFDNGGFHDNATNNSRLTVPAGAAGRYVVSGVVYYVTNATGTRDARIRKNGVLHAFSRLDANGGASLTALPISDIVDLAVGDYIELQSSQTSGGDLDVKGTNVYDTHLCMARLSS